ncbi:MAG: T9SS type A sorting domain-containing protein, partial [Chlorobium sp.]|nr:T9SS type A sorting domain-containing protein [Chlorobium sp.]
MKKLMFYYLVFALGTLVFITNLLPQSLTNKTKGLDFNEHVVKNNFNGPNTIAAADFDADGDVDVVATSFDGNYISLFENDDNQNFSEHYLIQNFGQPKVDVAFIDGDSDYDIIASSQTGDKIVWFENDGQAQFTEHLIIDNWESAGFVYAKDQIRGIDLDINGDGYTDFIATSTPPGNRISWFENDGNQNFTEHLLKENWYWVRRASAYDIDNDNDMDIVAAAKVGEIIWFENDGEEIFTEHLVVSGWGEPNAVLVGDVNNDGYNDLVATSVVVNEVVWFGNDGNGNFTKHIIKDQYNGAYGLDIADIDNDSDIDVMATAWIAGVGSVFENDGNQNFTEYVFCNSGFDLLHLFTIDLDTDQDLDILGACYASNLPQLRWWENSSTVSVKEIRGVPQKFNLMQNYPNPFNPSTVIEYHIPKYSFVTIKGYDVLGNEINTLVNEEKPAGRYTITFNANGLSSGIYFYQIHTNEYTEKRKMLLL